MEKETHQASPEMKLFFEKLLELKAFVKYHRDEPEQHEGIVEKIYNRLDAIIKEKK